MSIIHVNLLPPEKRRRERTSLSRFVALIVGTAVNVGIVAGMAYFALSTGKIRAETEAVQGDITRLKASVEKAYDVAKKEVDTIEKRSKAIAEVKKQRVVSWSEVIDNVMDVITANQWVWLTSLDMGEGAKGAKGAQSLDLTVNLSCNGSASEQDCKGERVYENQTNFKRDLWARFNVGAGAMPIKPGEKTSPFDTATGPEFNVMRHEDPNKRENIYIDYSAGVGRAVKTAAPAVPRRK